MLSRAVNSLPRIAILSRCESRPGCRLVWSISNRTSHYRQHTPHLTHASTPRVRDASTSSSTRWKTRQSRDSFAKEAKVAGLKSRAAFKLLEINSKHHLFHPGDTVVDLGYAPGSWSQVAISKTQPGGRVVGIDVIPAQPPRGVSTIQGNFLSAEIREEVRRYVFDAERGRARGLRDDGVGLTVEDLEEGEKGLIELEKQRDREARGEDVVGAEARDKEDLTQKELDRVEGRVVNVVLSDMSEPWPLTTSTWIKSVSNPYHRMMNTSGMAFRDHAGSMDLCYAALTFAYDTLITGGHFLCKFYQGSEDHALELRLKKLFEKVHRIKPDSSRKESREAYLVGLRRKPNVARELVLPEEG